MKVISIWQPWASLVVRGWKVFETRTWPAPASLIGQTLGIAATKNIVPAQRHIYESPEFQDAYFDTGLPPLEELPRGVLTGTVTLDSVEVVTEEFLADVSGMEQVFGYYDLGNYAWRLRDARPLAHPIPIQGKQGIYDYRGFDVGEGAAQAAETIQGRADQEGSGGLGSHLQAI